MLRRFLCFACVFLGGFFASACVETVPWADPVQCEEAGCTAENRECTALNRFEVVCGKCIDGFELRGGECLPIGVLQRCDDLDCGEQHRSCDAQANADAQCGACVDGYVEETGTCRPRTPCEQNADICGEGDCIDAGDDYNCECFAGFDFDGTECVDVDECEADPDACGPNEACTNTSGSYECACIEGFEFDGTECVDVDECEADPEVCDDYSTCTNTIGSYDCECIDGFEFDGTACVDIDECARFDDACSPQEICTNTIGSYECECAAGLLATESGCQPLVIDVAAGGLHSCAIMEDRKLYCWGSSSFGALGIGEDASVNTPPTLVSETLRWQSVEAGASHTCGITTDGDLYCWGRNDNGQLGNNDITARVTTPQRVVGHFKWHKVAINAVHTCGITQDQKLYCWGNSANWRLGDTNLPSNMPAPLSVQAHLNWSDISVGYAHSCGITTAGTLYCWGHNSHGQVGLGDNAPNELPPVIVGENHSWSSITAGNGFTCGITQQQLFCWGVGVYGQTALGMHSNVSEPTRSGDANDWTQVVAQGNQGCGRRNGDAYCWGSHLVFDGHLIASEPIPIANALLWSHVTNGNSHSCGISEDIAYCWGQSNDGQTGHSGHRDMFTPRPVQFFP